MKLNFFRFLKYLSIVGYAHKSSILCRRLHLDTISSNDTKIRILEVLVVFSVSLSVCTSLSFSNLSLNLSKASFTFCLMLVAYLSSSLCLILRFESLFILTLTAFSQTVLKSLMYPKLTRAVKIPL